MTTRSLAVVDKACGRVARVGEDLVRVLRDGAVLENVVQVGLQKARHSDRADLACFVGFLQMALVVSGTVAAWASSAGG